MLAVFVGEHLFASRTSKVDKQNFSAELTHMLRFLDGPNLNVCPEAGCPERFFLIFLSLR
jgi:hypothetical protein